MRNTSMTFQNGNAFPSWNVEARQYKDVFQNYLNSLHLFLRDDAVNIGHY